jgi:beta-N-acetylhexosaminidase
MSDDMQMKAIADHFGFEDAIVQGANAGIDLFWICHRVELQNRAIDVLIRAGEAGEVSRERLDDASRRIDRVFAQYVKPAKREADMSVIGSDEHRAIAAEIERRAGEDAVDEDPTERVKQ